MARSRAADALTVRQGRCGVNHDLVVWVQKGDQRAFEALVVADQPRLYRAAYGILRDLQSAEDATQQVLLDIWRDIRRLRDPSKYEGWSYRLLVRVCYAEAKRRPRWQTARDIRADDEPRASDAYLGVADRDQLERGFQQLSMDYRVILTLRFLVGMTPDEVAETLDLPDSTVYSRLQAALKAMRAALDADGRAVAHSSERQEAMR
jgi:RNA polymerase sigma-70 factor (ECF subfamily)